MKTWGVERYQRGVKIEHYTYHIHTSKIATSKEVCMRHIAYIKKNNNGLQLRPGFGHYAHSSLARICGL